MGLTEHAQWNINTWCVHVHANAQFLKASLSNANIQTIHSQGIQNSDKFVELNK